MKIWLLVLFIISVTLTSYNQVSKKKKPTNVIFILTDQWRGSALGYAGNDVVQTPQLDKFSKEAVNFKNAVSVLPVCTPYRASLMTGRYPTSTGMSINDLYLPSEEYCMAEIFSEAGYNTAYLGKWHLDGHGRKNFVAPERRQGWEFWKGAECDHNYAKEHYYDNEDRTRRFWEGYSTYSIADEANRYMQEQVSEEEAFCMFVSLSTPHFPHDSAPDKYKKMYPREKLTLPDNVPDDMKEWAYKELQGYYAHCSATDKAIGDIINKAKELGIYDNSIFVFTSDHGEMMGAHGYRPWIKHLPYSEASNIPFLISYPGMEKAKGKTAEAAITTPDILPSLLSLCDIDIPESIEGYDLSDIMKDPSKDIERAALYMNPTPFGIAFPIDEYRAIRTASYTYVKTPKGPSMLFDNRKDPTQIHNLVNQKSLRKVQSRLDKAMTKELIRIGDETIKPRDHYLKKFGYYGKEQFRTDYHIANARDVKVVITPNGSFPIEE
ncbi:sulfatase [Flavicella sp.]|uniref:sulfatase family protein n=1 Tax=Flavicella sp. TaxID=2957742 RepID=UPI00260674AC|nr:sulfatase [Flavicella sp.]MDG1804277.1 sulfatase [Flavicella sp.]MDG2280886.1 sulfatase [Flavicella sp.]